MCGICGFISRRRISEKELKRMNDTITYRGPDDSGILIKDLNCGYQLGLAQRRLSILDLSPAGHQPMFSSDGSVCIVFNGEIYNFKELRDELSRHGYEFRSDCDTEVILQAYMQWGIDCVKRFNGMFAAALFDFKSNKLYLFRDRLGVKPLYYYMSPEGLVFSSELKPIMAYPYFSKEISPEGLSLFLGKGYIQGTDSIFKGVYKLEAGTVLTFFIGNVDVSEYWSVRNAFLGPKFEGSYDEAKDELLKLLTDSVQKRMIADVPLGSFLSGGYDSTLITALMQEQSASPVKTFSIGFDNKQYDEAPYAQEVSQLLGTEHYCEYLPLNRARERLEDYSYYFDEPMADASGLAMLLLSEITKKQVTVALTGDAGDELFCGYDLYEHIGSYGKYFLPSRLMKAADRIIPVSKMNRRLAKLCCASSYDEGILSEYSTFAKFHSKLISTPWAEENELREIMKLTEDPKEKYMLSDIISYMRDDILTKVDRASMALSLETRAPLLDYRVVELALSLPIEYKFQNGERKRLLKDLTHNYVPKNVMERPKHGFGVPVTSWMHEDLKGFSRNLFEKDYIEKQGLFNYEEVVRMIKEFEKAGDMNYRPEYNLWCLLIFQLWWDRWME